MKKCKLTRLIKKYIIMITRSKDAPHKIALGVAIGLCCGVAIPLGQMILAIVLAFVFKANKVFAAAATFISNPYTSPIIYPIFCLIGAKIIGVNLTFSEIQKFINEMITTFSWKLLFNMGYELLICYIVGGTIVGVLLGITGYFATFKLAKLHQERRKQRLKSIKK